MSGTVIFEQPVDQPKADVTVRVEITGLRPGVRDCSHWCLPGVPDVWNQFLQHTLRCRACENGGKCRPAYVQDC